MVGQLKSSWVTSFEMIECIRGGGLNKYLTIKDNQEYLYKGGKFSRFGNDCLILTNGSNNWSVKKYVKDKDGNILYSSKFFIPTKEEDYNCSNDIKELKSIIKTQQDIINKLSYQVKSLSS